MYFLVKVSKLSSVMILQTVIRTLFFVKTLRTKVFDWLVIVFYLRCCWRDSVKLALAWRADQRAVADQFFRWVAPPQQNEAVFFVMQTNVGLFPALWLAQLLARGCQSAVSALRIIKYFFCRRNIPNLPRSKNRNLRQWGHLTRTNNSVVISPVLDPKCGEQSNAGNVSCVVNDNHQII